MWASNPEECNEDCTGTNIEFFYLYDDEDQKKYSELTIQEIRDRVFLRYLGRFCLEKEILPELKFELYINNAHVAKEDLYIKALDVPDSDYDDNFELNYKKIKENGEGFDTLSRKEVFYISTFLLSKKIQKKKNS